MKFVSFLNCFFILLVFNFLSGLGSFPPHLPCLSLLLLHAYYDGDSYGIYDVNEPSYSIHSTAIHFNLNWRSNHLFH